MKVQDRFNENFLSNSSDPPEDASSVMAKAPCVKRSFVFARKLVTSSNNMQLSGLALFALDKGHPQILECVEWEHTPANNRRHWSVSGCFGPAHEKHLFVAVLVTLLRCTARKAQNSQFFREGGDSYGIRSPLGNAAFAPSSAPFETFKDCKT